MNESSFTTAPSLLKEQLQRFNVQVHPPSFFFHVHSILCSLSSLTLSSLRAGSNWASARLVIIIFAINAKGVFLPRPEGSREAGRALRRPSLNSAHEVPVGLRNRPLGNLPADSSIVSILLCSFSLLLLTKHLSTRRRRKSTFHTSRRKRSIELDFPCYGSVTERKLGLLSSLSVPTYPGLTRAGNRQRVVFHIAGWWWWWWWCALVIRPLGRWVREKIVTRCSVTETDVQPRVPPLSFR